MVVQIQHSVIFSSGIWSACKGTSAFGEARTVSPKGTTAGEGGERDRRVYGGEKDARRVGESNRPHKKVADCSRLLRRPSRLNRHLAAFPHEERSAAEAERLLQSTYAPAETPKDDGGGLL